MALRRKRFHSGECLNKISPPALSGRDAPEDILHTQYVFENAYGGYADHRKALFDHAFANSLHPCAALRKSRRAS